MTPTRAGLALLGAVAVGACHRTVVVTSAPPTSSPPASSNAGNTSQRSAESERRGPSTAATLGIPPGHLPRPGQCRIWIPGTPPGRQPGPRSRVCAGIAALAPAGSWIIYRPSRDRRVVHVRVVDERRPGIVTRVRFFEYDTGRFIREGSAGESQDEDDGDDHGRRGDKPRERPHEPEHPANPGYDQPAEPAHDRPVEPPRERPADPPRERPVEPQHERPAEPGHEHPAEPAAATLDIPAGQMPDAGECRVWIPGTPPGRQPRPKTRPCEGIAAAAPAGSWVIYRPGDDRKVVHVRVVDERRAGVIIRVRIFDVETGKLVREENP